MTFTTLGKLLNTLTVLLEWQLVVRTKNLLIVQYDGQLQKALFNQPRGLPNIIT